MLQPCMCLKLLEELVYMESKVHKLRGSYYFISYFSKLPNCYSYIAANSKTATFLL